MLNQFSNLSCYEEFEMQATLAGISKIEVLEEIGHQIDDYYFFVSNDGIFNWFDLEGNHIDDPGVLKVLNCNYIPKTVTKCIIPKSVIIIGEWAFSYCTSLKEITIPDNVTSIGYWAFLACTSLKEITIPNSVKSIGNSTFSHCKSLTSITIPDSVSVTNIGGWIFYHCESLKEVIFKGKALKEVKQMKYYPFGIEDKSVFKFG